MRINKHAIVPSDRHINYDAGFMFFWLCVIGYFANWAQLFWNFKGGAVGALQIIGALVPIIGAPMGYAVPLFF